MANDEDEYFERARSEMFPMMKSSAMSIVIAGDPDPKLCLEIGAAIMFDKPIIVVVPPDRNVPASLRRIASVVIQGAVQDEATKKAILEALTSVLENDARIPGPEAVDDDE